MKCCICGKSIKGYGNNPWPVSKNPKDKCCDSCNNVVIAERTKEATFERAAILLQEFDYQKNGRENTREFLKYMLKEWL